MVRNQTVVTGPATKPMTFEPHFCAQKMTRRMATERATLMFCPTLPGKPSSALMTDIGGVMQASPAMKETPSMARAKTALFVRPPSSPPAWPMMVWTMAKVPPSPWWLTRIMSPTYLTPTTKVRSQKIMEKASTTSFELGFRVCRVSTKIPLKVYKGDVPISPKTTPVAPSIKSVNRPALHCGEATADALFSSTLGATERLVRLHCWAAASAPAPLPRRRKALLKAPPRRKWSGRPAPASATGVAPRLVRAGRLDPRALGMERQVAVESSLICGCRNTGSD
mmetsp:Transcript_18950/g.66132  ORF Transcript_18950/g.66132 Transcript_18950/m.66132 type:complete len:281 (-) Transcript_18950:141-983(-)